MAVLTRRISPEYMYSMCAQKQNESSNLPDGHRWLSLDENSKYAYIVGFLEGMFLGHCLDAGVQTQLTVVQPQFG